MEKINRIIDIRKINLLSLKYVMVAMLHTVLTLYSDKNFFCVSVWDHLLKIVFIKIIVFIILLECWKWIFLLIENKNSRIREIFSYSFPYFFFLTIYLFCNHSMSLSGDELNIYNQAIIYNIFPYHFTYLTGIVYIVSYMIIPCQMGVVLIKIIVQSITCGYCVYRMKYRFGKKGYLLYILFMLYPVVTNGIQVHRMHFYALLYLISSTKLIFDWRENRKLNNYGLFILSIAYSILSIWRKEGIYLILIAPVMICLAYRVQKKREIMKVFVTYFIIFGIMYMPQFFSVRSFTSESSHTYNSWFVNMCREGLDKNKYSQQMKIIDKYMSIDAVDYINEQLGDENYRDEYIAWLSGYVGIKDHATEVEYKNYVKTVCYLVIREPYIFIKTRIGLWNYTAERLNWSSMLALYKSLASNLNIPLIAVTIVGFLSLFRREWLLFFMTSFSVAHCMVTLLFSPAAYFKYYYHMYLLGWLFLIIALIKLIELKKVFIVKLINGDLI